MYSHHLFFDKRRGGVSQGVALFLCFKMIKTMTYIDLVLLYFLEKYKEEPLNNNKK
jgi:hypothetical protein